MPSASRSGPARATPPRTAPDAAARRVTPPQAGDTAGPAPPDKASPAATVIISGRRRHIHFPPEHAGPFRLTGRSRLRNRARVFVSSLAALAHAGKEGQDLADGGSLAGATGQWQVRLDVVAVAAAVLLLDDIAGRGQVVDDAVRTALGNAQAGCDVTQAHPRVVCDAQQHPGVVGQETPALHPESLSQFLEKYC